MALKAGGLLAKALKKHESRVCETCKNLVSVSETALGCTSHDKLIMPNYIPYHGNMNCKDWEKGAEG